MVFKKLLSVVMVATLIATLVGSASPANAAGQRGEVRARTVGAAALSLLIWPGIGQAVNDQPGKKVGTHAVLGLFPPYRLFSGYDALFDRQGGYVDGKI